MNATTTCDVRIGDWLAQPALNRIERSDRVVHVRPKLMDILTLLAAHPAEVVAQDAIIEAVWARRFMAESVLTRCMAELREALGDDAATPRYIETITKRGYRLIAPVEWVGRPIAAPPPSIRPDAGPEPSLVEAGVRPGGLRPRLEPAPPCGVRWGERDIPLAEGANLIGRGPGSAVRVSSARVSREHARIVVSGGRAYLEDLGSKNGTYLSGRPVHARTELSDGDEILVGHDVLVFRFCYPTGSTLSDVR